MDSSRFDDVPFLHQQEKKKTFSRTPRNAAICCVIWLSCSTVDQFFIETQNALVQNAPFQFHFSFRSDFIDKNMAKISTMDATESNCIDIGLAFTADEYKIIITKRIWISFSDLVTTFVYIMQNDNSNHGIVI